MAGRIRRDVSTAAIRSPVRLNRSDSHTRRLSHCAVRLHLQRRWCFSDCTPVALLRPCASSAALPYSWRDGSEIEAQRPQNCPLSPPPPAAGRVPLPDVSRPRPKCLRRPVGPNWQGATVRFRRYSALHRVVDQHLPRRSGRTFGLLHLRGLGSRGTGLVPLRRKHRLGSKLRRERRLLQARAGTSWRRVLLHRVLAHVWWSNILGSYTSNVQHARNLCNQLHATRRACVFRQRQHAQ